MKIDAANAKYGQEALKTDKFKTVSYYQLSDAKKKVKAKNSAIGKFMSKFSKKPHGWKTNPLDSFYMSNERAAAMVLQVCATKQAVQCAAAVAHSCKTKSLRKGLKILFPLPLDSTLT